jgi:hypothetical protein
MGERSIRDRYPPPWRIDAIPGGFRVVSSNGITVAWIYALEGQQAAASGSVKLTHREALAIAKTIAALPTSGG